MAILPIENTKHLHLSDLVATNMLLDDVFVFCRQTPLAEVKYVNTIIEFTDLATAINALGPPSVLSVTASGPLFSTGGLNPNISLTGIVPIANGGTNIGTIGASGTIIYSNGTQLVSTAVGLAGQVLSSNGAGAPTWITSSAGWGLLGNAGTVDGINFLGTTDNIPLNFRVNNQKAGRIDATNTFFGYQTGNINIGIQNVAFGYQCLLVNTLGINNTAIGNKVLVTNTTGFSNTGVGNFALFYNTIGNTNTAVGEAASQNNTTGNNNVSVGKNTLLANISGSNNIAIGVNALGNNLFSAGNVAIGHGSQLLSTVAFNTSVGFATLQFNTLGINNTTVGFQALLFNTTGNQNTALGSLALMNNTLGNNNVGIGYQSLFSNTIGANNTALGNSALNANTSGSNNTIIGYNSGAGILTGNANTILGANITALAGGLSNNIIIAEGSGIVRLQFDNTGALTLTGPTVSPASATASTNKVKVNVNGTDYYLLATTIS